MILADALKQTISTEDQFELAKELATNCGYKLVVQDDERSLEIKSEIMYWKSAEDSPRSRLIIQGLEALLK